MRCALTTKDTTTGDYNRRLQQATTLQELCNISPTKRGTATQVTATPTYVIFSDLINNIKHV